MHTEATENDFISINSNRNIFLQIRENFYFSLIFWSGIGALSGFVGWKSISIFYPFPLPLRYQDENTRGATEISNSFLQHMQDPFYFFPPFILAISFTLMGKFLKNNNQNKFKSIYVLAGFFVCFLVGWELAVSPHFLVGSSTDFQTYIISGLIGGISIAVGHIIFWKIEQSKGLYLILISLSGGIAGLMIFILGLLLNIDLPGNLSSGIENIITVSWQAIMFMATFLTLRVR